MQRYSIIIPIHNEKKSIIELLNKLKYYAENNHEVLIIDDGSNDGTTELLQKYNFIKLIICKKNKGKGSAIRLGLLESKYNKIIIFDGDMELDPSEISKLMILDKKKNIYQVMGYRFKNLNPLKSNFDWGNFMFTSFFNIIFQSNHKDILCCAKSFYLDEKIINYLFSNNFDIDVELSSIFTIRNRFKRTPHIFLNYKRRTLHEGKKLQISDGWHILFRIIKMYTYL